MKTKKPVDMGPRKGFSRIYLGEGNGPRIRICNSKGRWKWGYSDVDCNLVPYPCWLYSEHKTWKDQIKAMKNYDKKNGIKTIFLGYVKDTE